MHLGTENTGKQYSLPKVSIHIMQEISLVNSYVPRKPRMLTHLHRITQALCGCTPGHMILCVCVPVCVHVCVCV